MKDAPAFDFYPERWLSGVAMFSDTEQLAYLRLLCYQWLHEGLPAELQALRRLAGKGVSSALLAKFPVSDDGQRRNARLEIIRTEQRARIARKSEQRRAAANARWHGEKNDPQPARKPSPHATASPPQCASPPAASLSHQQTDADALPTTHHPPPTRTDHSPSRSREVPTLGRVQQFAESVLITPDEAEAYWLAREASDWQRSSNGISVPVGNWQADLRAYTNSARQRAADKTKPRHTNAASTHQSTAPGTANRPDRYA